MALSPEKPGEKYGFVSYVGDAPFYNTRGYDGANGVNDPNPEGEYMYEFNEGNWKSPIYTKKDQEYFMANESRFQVELPGGRPARPRFFKKDELKETKMTVDDAPQKQKPGPKPKN